MIELFIVSVSLLVFIYAVYPLLIYVIGKSRKSVEVSDNFTYPDVAILIAAYNEDKFISKKIRNTLSLNYKGSFKVYVVSDGSTDRTNEIVLNYPEVELLYTSVRSGKSAAINRAMKMINEEITVFTDANVMLNDEALNNLIRHYSDPLTGGVSGEKKVIADARAGVASTEGYYWKYESFLKYYDAKVSSLAGSAGELFSIRTKLYSDIESDTLLDDFMISLNVIRKGYRIAYEKDAIASELPSSGLREEYKRKVRISAGGIQSTIRSLDILNPFRYGIFSFQILIHRISRWTIAPLALAGVLVGNIFLMKVHYLFLILLTIQLCMYLLMFSSLVFRKTRIENRILKLIIYFLFMHYCVFAGFVKYISGQNNPAWNKAGRLASN